MSGDGRKWFKGTRKAIERLPYRLAGTKPEEDPLIVRWTQDFQAARGALSLLLEYTKEADKSWHNLMDSNRDLLVAFLSSSKPILSGATRDASQELIEDQSEGLKRYADVWANFTVTDRGVIALAEEFYESFKFRTQEALKEIKLVEALLAKVGRKQLDYDRMRVAHKKAMTSANDTHIANADIELRRAEEIYRNLLQYVKAMVPQFLSALNSFLSAMVLRHLRLNQDVLQCWQKQMENCALAQGSKLPEAWTDIYEAWIHDFTRVQYLVESIPLLRDGSITHVPMSMPEAKFGTSVAGQKILNVASAAAGTGEHVATSAYHSITHLNVPNVAFVSTEGGIFASVNLEEAKHKNKPTEIAKPEFVLAKFDYSGEEGDLSFKAGDRIRVIDHGVEDDVNWWCGEFDGKVGLFPRDFVNHTPEPESQPGFSEVSEEPSQAASETEATIEPDAEKAEPEAKKAEPEVEEAVEPGAEGAVAPEETAEIKPAPKAEIEPETALPIAPDAVPAVGGNGNAIAEHAIEAEAVSTSKSELKPETTLDDVKVKPEVEAKPQSTSESVTKSVIEPETEAESKIEPGALKAKETVKEPNKPTVAEVKADEPESVEHVSASAIEEPKTLQTSPQDAAAKEANVTGLVSDSKVAETATKETDVRDCSKPIVGDTEGAIEDAFDTLSIDDEAPKSAK